MAGDDLLTPEALALPGRMARRHARPGTELYEELESAGNLALVQALGSFRYDPARGRAPADAFAAYATECVRLRLLSAAAAERGGPASLDDRGPGGDWGGASARVADHRTGLAPGEAPPDDPGRFDRGRLARLLRRLRPLHRAVYLLHEHAGLTHSEVARRLRLPGGHCSRQQRSCKLLAEARRRLLELGGVLPPAPNRARARARAAKGRGEGRAVSESNGTGLHRAVGPQTLADCRATLRGWLAECPDPAAWEPWRRQFCWLLGEAGRLARLEGEGGPATAAPAPAPRLTPEGTPCGRCGALALVRTGACLTCTSCGDNSGCG